MKYGSVCSGIEAATVAWHALGWTPAFFSEIDRFPSEVLAHHYGSNLPGEPLSRNAPPNLGDMTRFEEWPDADVDLLVGGTPCQDYSVAGRRLGMAGERGQLTLTYVEIAARYRPRWIVWENVPGVLSSHDGRDFARFLGDLSGQIVEVPRDGWQNSGIVAGIADAYGLAWVVRDAQYVRVDGFGRAVPQRRRRVFVVGYLGDWRRAAAVLLERASLCGDPPPRREAGKGVAGTVDARASRGFNGQDAGSDKLIASRSVAATLTRGAESAGKGGYAGRRQEDDINLVAFDTTQITSASNYSQPKPGDPCHPLAAGAHPPAIAFDARQSEVIQYGPISGPLDTDGHSVAVHTGWAVRRLTPTECERLQGFPDGYTAIPRAGGKPAADGPRYKALGNSMACNVMRWIGRRIEMVDALAHELNAEEAA